MLHSHYTDTQKQHQLEYFDHNSICYRTGALHINTTQFVKRFVVIHNIFIVSVEHFPCGGTVI